MNSETERKNLLITVFEPSKITNPDGTAGEGPPFITPPAFISVLKTFIENFGNVEKFNIMNTAKLLINEASDVATELYGQSMSPRDQQRLAWAV